MTIYGPTQQQIRDAARRIRDLLKDHKLTLSHQDNFVLACLEWIEL